MSNQNFIQRMPAAPSKVHHPRASSEEFKNEWKNTATTAYKFEEC